MTLDDLARLLRAPVEVFFRNRLQTTLDQLDDLTEPDEPFALNALQKHQIGADLLNRARSAQTLTRLQGSGQLPLAAFGERSAQGLLEVAEQVCANLDPWQARYPLPLPAQPVDLTFDGGRCLSGTLAGLRCQADHSPKVCMQLMARPGAVWQGKKGAAQVRGHVLVSLWVRHLAGCASGLTLTSVVVGVDGQVVLPPMDSAAAHHILAGLVQAYGHAWAAALPVACKTAWAWLHTQAANALLPPEKSPKDPHDAARAAFDTQPGGRFPGEWAESAYLQRAFDAYDDIAEGLPHWAQALYGDLAGWVVTQLEASA